MMLSRENLVLALLIIICILFYFINSYLSDSLYSQTPQYLQNKQEIQQLIIENNALQMELLQKESFIRIATESAKMGLTMPESPIYLPK